MWTFLVHRVRTPPPPPRRHRQGRWGSRAFFEKELPVQMGPVELPSIPTKTSLPRCPGPPPLNLHFLTLSSVSLCTKEHVLEPCALGHAAQGPWSSRPLVSGPHAKHLNYETVPVAEQVMRPLWQNPGSRTFTRSRACDGSSACGIHSSKARAPLPWMVSTTSIAILGK